MELIIEIDQSLLFVSTSRPENESDSDFEESKGGQKKRKRKDDGPVSIHLSSYIYSFCGSYSSEV